jgi:hypothetical protein
MVAITQGAANCAFILTEANGQRSRENATLVAGVELAAGTVLSLHTSSTPNNPVYQAWDGSRDSSTTHDPAPTAILLYNTDTLTDNVAKAVSVLARDAEVNLKVLTYPTQTEEEQDVIRLLAAVGIICRT